MGSLIIKQVEYNGDNYYFKSPEFTTGINIIKGDNGSGKSTFSYFIEFGLGGDIKIFNKNNLGEKYKEIIEDKNNYIELIVLINNQTFILKRFIGKNDVFVKFLNGEVKSFCTERNHCQTEIFSDWLLSQLGIKNFELSLGATDWYFNFNDLFRLLYYDQDTEPRKIYKKPNSDNFVTDSAVIRKSIFETLMGNSSDEYFLKMNQLNESKLKLKESKILLEEFNRINPNLRLTLEGIKVELETSKEQFHKLIASREEYQKGHIKIDDKFQQLEDKKRELIQLQLDESESKIKKKHIQIEKNKIERFFNDAKDEIGNIEKTIFTHEKLNLFDFKICPFCASDVIKEEKKCICGSTIKENNYEKFLYDTSEYKEILKDKNKRLETINSALNSYDEEFQKLNIEIRDIQQKINELNKFLKDAIESIEYSGNSQMTDDIDSKITKIKDEIFELEKLEDLYRQKDKYEKSFNTKNVEYTTKQKTFKSLEYQYKETHNSVITNFNTIYNSLMEKSSAKTNKAIIDDDYMPLIDSGVYREKSASVPIRMMYFFTLLSMSLKYTNIKHPKFLLMDTPEEAGIDNIAENIELFYMALELSENKGKDYQFILTTGLEKCPKKYEEYMKLEFNKEENRFILSKVK